MQKITRKMLIDKAAELLQNGTVDRVLGWKNGEFAYDRDFQFCRGIPLDGSPVQLFEDFRRCFDFGIHGVHKADLGFPAGINGFLIDMQGKGLCSGAFPDLPCRIRYGCLILIYTGFMRQADIFDEYFFHWYILKYYLLISIWMV